MEVATTIPSTALAAGLSWTSGLRLYMTVFAAGLFGRTGWIDLPDTLRILESPWVMSIAGALMVIEFLADKIPGVDSVWDTVHTFIRIPAGAVLGAAALGKTDPVLLTAAGLLGGTFAAGAHATKAGSRALINTSPEPFSNWTASFSEDAIVAAGLWAAFFHPWISFALFLLLSLVALWLLPKLWRGLQWLFKRLSV